MPTHQTKTGIEEVEATEAGCERIGSEQCRGGIPYVATMPQRK
jgi:hypothetical protein